MHDFKSAIQPYLNEDIKYHQIPFLFKFGLVENTAVMWYKLFSTHSDWLPERPDTKDIEDGTLPIIRHILLNEYAYAGGKAYFLDNGNISLTDAGPDQLKERVNAECSIDNIVSFEDGITSDMIFR